MIKATHLYLDRRGPGGGGTEPGNVFVMCCHSLPHLNAPSTPCFPRYLPPHLNSLLVGVPDQLSSQRYHGTLTLLLGGPD